MAKHNDGLEALVADFIDSLRGVIRQQAMEVIQQSMGSSGGTRPTKAVSNGHSRGKGQKRDEGALEALQEKFLAFVGKHPDLRIEQINKELGTTTKDLQLPIRKLIADGQIKPKGKKRSTTYSVTGKKSKK